MKFNLQLSPFYYAIFGSVYEKKYSYIFLWYFVCIRNHNTINTFKGLDTSTSNCVIFSEWPLFFLSQHLLACWSAPLAQHTAHLSIPGSSTQDYTQPQVSLLLLHLQLSLLWLRPTKLHLLFALADVTCQIRHLPNKSSLYHLYLFFCI